MNKLNANDNWKKALLICGIIASLLYPVTDIVAGNLYKGYSFNQQAVSELFAIGAPTSRMVVILFTIGSLLLIAFGIGIGLSFRAERTLRALSFMILGNGLDSLVLWNFFPMHMRGDQPTITDTMHSLLAINPFVLISIILGAIFFRNWFRYYSIATMLIMVICAIKAFSYIPLLINNQPTPWLGLTERISQYAHQLWHAVLAGVLFYEKRLKYTG
jgi:hypothetical protein